MEYVGIDLHKKESQICLLTETGEVMERRIRTEPQRFAEVLGGRPRARILVEASTESEWVARCLEALGHEVVVADPNFTPMYATRTRKVKTDRRDARALQEACLLGAYRKWGPYLSERQWGTVREDYSDSGNAWDYFSHDQARSRAYRWGEDGLAGVSDDRQLLCFALALWNGKDPILKERLYGLTNSEGNHGEDVKEYYFYLDSTPTHSYMKFLYKYPQAAFPYGDLVEANRRGGSTTSNTSCSTRACSTRIATSTCSCA
jgi:transposase